MNGAAVGTEVVQHLPQLTTKMQPLEVPAVQIQRVTMYQDQRDVVVLMPMLTSTADEIERIVDVLGEAIDEVCT